MTNLKFGYEFNQPIILPPNLTHVTFGEYFNQPINLPPNITHLSLGLDFAQHIILPNIIYMEIDSNNNIIDSLPNSLEELELGFEFNLPIDNLPSGLKKLVIYNYRYSYPLNNLPSSLEYLELEVGAGTKFEILPFNLPRNLKMFKIMNY